MTALREVRAELVRLAGVDDSAIEVTEAALMLAQLSRPRALMQPYRRHLARLVADVSAYVKGADAGTVDLRAEALAQVLARRYGYRAADPDDGDPDQANLTRVIDGRRGTPAALGVLYLHVARALDWPAAGLAFPQRFLVRIEGESERVIVDPAAGGEIVTPPDMRALLKAATGIDAELAPPHYRALGNREILLRLHDERKVRLLRRERLDDALHAVETMLFFAPAVARLWREAGILNARLDRLEAAVAALEEYMRHDPGDTARYRASVLLQELRSRLS